MNLKLCTALPRMFSNRNRVNQSTKGFASGLLMLEMREVEYSHKTLPALNGIT
jgi:hypothetical protein